MTDSKTPDTYDVGFKKPPKHTQFKKGKSGNPKGRRKGIRNLSTDVKKTLNAPVPITEGGKKRTVSTQEALLLRLKDKALKGDVKAIDRLVTLAGAHNNENLIEDARDQLGADDAAILKSYEQRRRQKEEAEAKRQREIDEAYRLSGIEEEEDAWLN